MKMQRTGICLSDLLISAEKLFRINLYLLLTAIVIGHVFLLSKRILLKIPDHDVPKLLQIFSALIRFGGLCF
jgi:hypothetical protein